MGKRPTPSPDPKSRVGCLSFAALVGVLGIAVSTKYDKYWPILFTLPILVMLTNIIYGKLLLSAGITFVRSKQIHGVLVTSDSPIWKEYIEDKWIPRIGGSLETLNWSTHKTWKRTVYTRVFYEYVGTRENYCPSVVLLRGLKEPLVFRFFYAFRDAKHGNMEALNKLEKRLFDELELKRGHLATG